MISVLVILLFTGCFSNSSVGETNISTNETTNNSESVTNEISTVIQQNDTLVGSSITEPDTDYKFDEGIFEDKEWYSPSLDNETGQEVSNVNVAIEIATTEFQRIQKQGIGTSYVLKGVFFDTADEIWIVWFSQPDELMPGACYNIAVSKSTGKILHAWPGE
jgi:hypothetical protein